MWRPASLVLIPLALAGCKINTDYFSEYRGVNLIANADFAALESDGTTPKWQTTTYGLITAAPTTDYYMTWEEADPTDSLGLGLNVGPDTVSPVYRLEIKNLIPDGDFEAESNLAASATLPAGLATIGWASKAGAPLYRFSNAHADNGLPSPAVFTTVATISNRSMLFAAQGADDQVRLELDTALGTWTDDLWLPGFYRLRVDFINGGVSGSLGLALLDGAGANLQSNTTTENSGIWTRSSLSLPPDAETASLSKTFTIVAGDTRMLAIGGSTAGASDAAIIDNVRLLPADQELAAVLKFSSLSSGVKQLLPGTLPGDYIFTLQVRDDPTADQTGASGAAHSGNRFEPSGLTITIKGRDKVGLRTLAQSFIVRPSGGWTTWTPITLNGGLDFVDSDEDLSGDAALIISLVPTNAIDLTTGGRDVGSLLVAQPTFTYNP